MAKRAYQVYGIVQGVGFRPYVHRLAIDLAVHGFVRNEGDFVHIELQGLEEVLDEFVKKLEHHVPPAALINEMIPVSPDNHFYDGFHIAPSESKATSHFSIPSDLGICQECTDELHDPKSRYYRYPFISCTNCGPRYTITRSLPFDRQTTTMDKFPLCDSCEKEYQQLTSRRYHAQATACTDCGPILTFLDDTGIKEHGESALEQAKNALRQGKIVAILGIGGFHIAVDARNNEAVARLRMNKIRPSKPFAVMMRKSVIKNHAIVSKLEWDFLDSPIRPIVLLKKSDTFALAPEVAPHLSEIGVFLPYTGLHELLLDDDLNALVMTSGNISGDPLAYTIQDGLDRLGSVVDAFLVHHREILRPVDDSVLRASAPFQLIRRSRGYVPGGEKIRWQAARSMPVMLAAGGDLKNSFAVAHSGMAWVGPYLGDLENERTQSLFVKEVKWYTEMLHRELEVIVHDLHPGYFSTQFAMSRPEPKIAVQHHHAHMASVMLEHDITHPVIGVMLDGTGYGDNGEWWGGEVLVGDLQDYVRLGHLAPTRYISGDQAVREPWRLVYSYLSEWGLWEEFGDLVTAKLQLERQSLRMMKAVQHSKYKGFTTTSMGRLFDVAGSLILDHGKSSFEGELPMRLESIVDASSMQNDFTYDFPVSQRGTVYELHIGTLLRELLVDIKNHRKPDELSTKWHQAIINGLVQLTVKISEDTGYRDVVVSGGVWMNAVLLRAFIQEMKRRGLEVYTPAKYPANDGGLALGQIAVATARLM